MSQCGKKKRQQKLRVQLVEDDPRSNTHGRDDGSVDLVVYVDRWTLAERTDYPDSIE
jgi:hypothetical protein